MAKLVPGNDDNCGGACSSNAATLAAEEDEGGCGSANGRTAGGEMATMDKALEQNDSAAELGLETEVTIPTISRTSTNTTTANCTAIATKKPKKIKGGQSATARKPGQQVMGQCKICGYLSSQEICKACTLLDGLNKNRPKNKIELAYDEEEVTSEIGGVNGATKGMKSMVIGLG
jgi:cytoplasmic tRNA 2-thiolation protein 1